MKLKTIQRERGATNQRTRERYFRLHPLCVMCEKENRVTAATELDHIVALINGGTNEDSNRQGLCSEHHKAKTAQDMGKTYTPRRRIADDGWPV